MADDPNDSHPADPLINDIRSLFNGQMFIKGIRDAWDRHMASTPAPAPQDNSYLDEAARDANASFAKAQANRDAMSAASAAKVRAKAAQKMGN